MIGHSLITGATGSGKTYATGPIICALIEAGLGFTVFDTKGDHVDLTLRILTKYPRVLDRVVYIDFGGELVSPYNILLPIGDFDYFIHRRTETLRELLPGRDALSLRAVGILRNSLSALASASYPLSALDRFLTDATLRTRVLRSAPHETRYYFQKIFHKETPQTVGSLRGRIAALLASRSIKQSCNSPQCPDFRLLQDEGRIILISCAGRTISRGVRKLLQGLVLSDVRQCMFARENKTPHIVFCDEAQNFFKTSQQQEDLIEILNQGRAFGVFLCLLCQNLHTTASGTDILESILTNIRWSLSFRSTPKDVFFLRSALPVTGTLRKPTRKYQEKSYYTENEERSLILEGVASLPDRTGWMWERSSGGARIIQTSTLSLENVNIDTLKRNPNFGQRELPRKEEVESETDIFAELEEHYKAN